MTNSSQTTTWTIPIRISITLDVPTQEPPQGIAVPTLPTPPVKPLFAAAVTPPVAAPAPQFSLDSLMKTEFDWRTALSLVLASQLAYSDADGVENTARNVWNLQTCTFIDNDDTECFMATSDSAVLVAFRGTASVANWLTDLNALSTERPYGTVHRGFLSAFLAVDAQLRQRLAQFPQRPVLLTGHSLGGALATIAAAEWAGQIPISWIYTYGQPAVGKGTFPAFMQQYYGNNFFRFVNNNDIVPQVPPTYVHVGKLLQFDAAGNLENPIPSTLLAATAEEAVRVQAAGGGRPMMTEEEFDRMRSQLLAQRAGRRSAGIQSLAAAPELEALLSLPSISDHRLDQYIAKIAAKAQP